MTSDITVGAVEKGAPAPAARRAPDRKLKMIVILGALSAVGPLSVDMYLPALPRLTDDLSTTAVLAQLTLTACVVGLAAGQIVAGPLSDRFGRRRPLMVGLVGYSLASLLCAVSPTVEVLVAMRLVQGVTGAAAIVIARAIVRDRYEGVAAARFFALLMLVSGLAPILAPLLGAQVLRVAPWPGVFVVLSAMGAALLLVALLALPETLPPDDRQSGGFTATLSTFRGLLRDRVFVGYALTLGFSFAALFAYVAGSSFVLQDIHGLSPQEFSIVFGVNSVGIISAGQVGGYLAGRIRLRALLGTGLTMVGTGGVALLAMVVMDVGLAGLLPALFFVVAGQGLVMPNATALALEGRPPRVAGSASALLGTTQFAVGGAAAPLAGIAGTGTALPMAITIAALPLVAITSVLVLTRTRQASSAGF